MFLESGTRCSGGSLALVSQQAWIFNGTLRDNVLMGLEFKEDWYWRVVAACALDSDIKVPLNLG